MSHYREEHDTPSERRDDFMAAEYLAGRLGYCPRCDRGVEEVKEICEPDGRGGWMYSEVCLDCAKEDDGE